MLLYLVWVILRRILPDDMHVSFMELSLSSKKWCQNYLYLSKIIAWTVMCTLNKKLSSLFNVGFICSHAGVPNLGFGLRWPFFWVRCV